MINTSLLFAQSDTLKPSVTVDGEVTKPLKLYAADIAKMKHSTVNVLSRDGKEHSYSGVPVLEILNMAGVTMGKDLHGENLSKYLLVKCADGYEVLFSLAEIDTTFTNRTVVLADSTDGKLLPSDRGPFQLAVPGEKKPARSCFQVTEFIVKFAKE